MTKRRVRGERGSLKDLKGSMEKKEIFVDRALLFSC